METFIAYCRLSAIEDAPCGYVHIITTDLEQLMSDIDAATDKYAKSEEAIKQRYNIPVCKIDDLVNEKYKIEHVSLFAENFYCSSEREDILMMHPRFYKPLCKDCLCDRPNIPGIDFPKLLDTIRPMVVDVVTNDISYYYMINQISQRTSQECHVVDDILRRFAWLCLCVSKLKEAIKDDDLSFYLSIDGNCSIGKNEDDEDDDGLSPFIRFNLFDYIFNFERSSFIKEDFCCEYQKDLLMAICDRQPYEGLNAILLGTLYCVALNAHQHDGLWLKDVDIFGGDSIIFDRTQSHETKLCIDNHRYEDNALYFYWDKYNPETCSDTFDPKKWMIK